jgi:hypothetical protein
MAEPACDSWSALDGAPLPRQARLDLLDVAMRLRPAARILVRTGTETMVAAMLLEALQLDACAARGLACVPLGVDYADGFEAAPGRPAERMAVLYVSTTLKAAESLRGLDESADDANLGRALGYPDCCIDAISSRGGVPAIADAVSLYATEGTFDPLVWPPAAIADGPLLPHFPCTSGCVTSRRLAAARWDGACRHLPAVAARVLAAARAAYWVDGSGRANTDVFGATAPAACRVERPRLPLPGLTV